MKSQSDSIDVKFDSVSFQKYIAHDCDRLSFLQGYLSDWGVDSSVLPLDGKKHLYVNFPSSSYNPMFKIKTIISHYDRVSGSPGANDNSFANFALADFAAELYKSKQAHNIRIFLRTERNWGKREFQVRELLPLPSFSENSESPGMMSMSLMPAAGEMWRSWRGQVLTQKLIPSSKRNS